MGQSQNQILNQGNTSSFSRNYGNQLAASKTQNESQIYNQNIGNSFSVAMNQGNNRTSFQKSSASGGRPITSSSGKLVNKKKVVSQGGGIGPNG